MFPMEIIDQTGSGIYHQRGTSNDQGVSCLNGLDGSGDHSIVKSFLVKDYIRFDQGMAFRTERNAL